MDAQEASPLTASTMRRCVSVKVMKNIRVTKNGADDSRIQPEARSRPESRPFLVIIFILGSYVCNVGDHPNVPEVACNRIVRLAFKFTPCAVP